MTEILKMFDLTPFDVVMIGVGVAFFFVLWAVLERVLFAPYLQLLETRESMTSGSEALAHEKRGEVEKVTREYDARIQQARIEAMTSQAAIIQKAQQRAQQIVEKAEGEAQEHVRTTRWDTKKSYEEAQKQTRDQVEALASQLVGSITGTSGVH